MILPRENYTQLCYTLRKSGISLREEFVMTIKEIAQLAGVSSAAVSRYLNGGYVSAEKKEQIRKVIEETGYRPSAQARILRTKKACLVGVVVPKINSESISRVTAGIEQVLSRRGYQMLLASTDNDPAKELTSSCCGDRAVHKVCKLHLPR